MNVPNRLYKYQSCSMHSLANLAEAKVRISDPLSFNDPFDCAIDAPLGQMESEDYRLVLSKILDWGTPADDAAKKQAQSAPDAAALRDDLEAQIRGGLIGAIRMGLEAVKGVCCFTELVDSLLMWGHYADGQRGFCLEFDTNDDLFRKAAHRVVYSDEFPVINARSIVAEKINGARDLLLTKAACWSYEKEWRVLHDRASIDYGYERKNLTGVFFGAKMLESHKSMIATLLSHTDTRFHEMRLDDSSFRLVDREVDFRRFDYRAGASK